MNNIPCSHWQVDLAGDSMVACALSSTGEAIGFGGSGGYVHLWALKHQPCLNVYSEVGARHQCICTLTPMHSTCTLALVLADVGVVNVWPQPLETPVALPTPSVHLTEISPFSAAETYFPEQVLCNCSQRGWQPSRLGNGLTLPCLLHRGACCQTSNQTGSCRPAPLLVSLTLRS